MNYRIELYETFDDNGFSIIELFLEINGQIYRVTKKFLDLEDRNNTIARCFVELSEMLKGENIKCI